MKGDEMEVESSKVPAILLEAIAAHDVINQILLKANLPAENVLDILKNANGFQNEGRLVLQKLQTLQSKAFLCLNNLVEAAAIEDLGGADKLFKIWKDLGVLALS